MMTNQQDYQPILDSQQQQLALTISASDSVDAKALGVFAASVAFAIFGLQSLMQSRPWILILMFTAFAASMACTFVGFRREEYIGPGVELTEHPEYFNLNREELILQLISDTGLAIALNSQENDRKRSWLKAGFILIGIALLLMAGCILKV